MPSEMRTAKIGLRLISVSIVETPALSCAAGGLGRIVAKIDGSTFPQHRRRHSSPPSLWSCPSPLAHSTLLRRDCQPCRSTPACRRELLRDRSGSLFPESMPFLESCARRSQCLRRWCRAGQRVDARASEGFNRSRSQTTLNTTKAMTTMSGTPSNQRIPPFNMTISSIRWSLAARLSGHRRRFAPFPPR